MNRPFGLTLRGIKMPKAYEVTVWEPLWGKREKVLALIAEFKKISLAGGTSEFLVLEGSIGALREIMVIQTFKNLADNGAVNENFADTPGFKDWVKKMMEEEIVKVHSHDLYVGVDE